MITIKKNKNYVVTGEQTYNFKSQNFKVVALQSEKDKINLETRNDEYLVDYKNNQYIGELIESHQNKYTVSLNGNTYSFTIDTETTHKRKEKLKAANQLKQNCNILAPMPGKITELLIAEGAVVDVGSPLLLLEAMKMQNQIHSNRPGKVKKIHIKNGDSVMTNQLLIEMTEQDI